MRGDFGHCARGSGGLRLLRWQWVTLLASLLLLLGLLNTWR